MKYAKGLTKQYRQQYRLPLLSCPHHEDGHLANSTTTHTKEVNCRRGRFIARLFGF